MIHFFYIFQSWISFWQFKTVSFSIGINTSFISDGRVFEKYCVVEWNNRWLLYCRCLSSMNGLQLEFFTFRHNNFSRGRCIVSQWSIDCLFLLSLGFEDKSRPNSISTCGNLLTIRIMHDSRFFSFTIGFVPEEKFSVLVVEGISRISICWFFSEKTWQSYNVKIQNIHVFRTPMELVWKEA